MILALFACFASCAYPVNHTCTEKNRAYDCGMELLCVNGTCQPCVNHEDCGDQYSCKDVNGFNICRFEPLTHEWPWRLIVGMVTVFIAGIAVSGVGIGGGGLFVPIMMLVIGFPAEYSISSSNPLIFGGSLAVTLFNLRARHAFYDRPLINYNVAAIIEPISWLGTIIGVIINGVIPDWLLYLIQFVLLAYTAVVTFQKGIKEYRARKAVKALEETASSPPVSDPHAAVDVTPYDRLYGDTDGSLGPAASNTCDFEEKAPTRAFNPWVLVVLGVVWVIFVILPFIRGGSSSESLLGIKFCSWQYWVITFAPFPVYITISALMIRIAKNYPVIGAKADMNAKVCTMLIVCGIIAGVASGFLGIGGGMIKGPMLLQLGIEAEEMAATSSFLILLTSGITSIQFIARGTMPYQEFAIYVGFGFVSFLVGVFALKIVVQKTGRRDVLLYVLAISILVAAVLTSYVGIDEVVRSIKNHQNMGFRPYCRTD